jgi:serine phosphatase RsbU (regulator of sigma subunit)
MADVAGKGVPAALFMAMSRTLLRSAAINRVSPAATLTRVNQLIVTEARSDLFVSVFYGVWAPQSGRFVYANAGHNAPLWVNGAGEVRPLAGHGVVLGALDDAEYQETEVSLQPGELLLLFTDGLTEAINAAEEEFGGERVRALLREAWQANAPADHTLARLAEAVQTFSGSSEMFDDVTMALLKRTR